MIQNLIYSPYNYANNSYDRLNRMMNTNMQQIHSLYYPDLTEDEFNADMLNRNKLLYQRGKLEQLAKYGSWTNCAGTYSRVKNDENFKEIIGSKYLNNPQNFVQFINNLNSLETQRQQKFAPYIYQYGHLNFSVQKPIAYEKYDIKDYLKMLNDFCKNDKISDDLKKYFMLAQSDKIDLYYTKFDRLNDSDNPVEILTEKIHLYIN